MITQIFRFLTSFMLSLLGCTSIIAQEDSTSSFNLVDRLNASPIVQGNFRQEQLMPDIEEPIISTGNFIFVDSLGIYWHVTNPAEFSTSFLSPQNDFRVNHSPQQPKAVQRVGQMLVSFLSGDTKEISRLFDMSLIETAGSWTAELRPKRRSVKKHLLLITLTGDEAIRKIILTSKDNNQTTIDFSDIHFSAGYSLELCTNIQNHLGLPRGCIVTQKPTSE
ncbi:MAG: outer membrane lipoprotein carrier protein LolA [Gammaproteobacteria bacterium]|nr:outer membrane lipoprotein carrier protein LolA [Gammaproteobacteria bacterium]